MTDLKLMKTLRGRADFLMNCSWKTEKQYLDWVYELYRTGIAFDYLEGPDTHALKLDRWIDKFTKVAQENNQSIELTLARIQKVQSDWKRVRLRKD